MGCSSTKLYLMFPVKMKNRTGLLPYSGRTECRDGWKGSGWEARKTVKMMNKAEVESPE